MAKTTPFYTSVLRERQARRHVFCKLLYRDKMPALILFMATLVGVLSKKAVNGVQALCIAASAAFVLSALLTMMKYFLVCRYAPKAGYSGIPEIEGTLEDLWPVCWWQVITVKFIDGMGTRGAGMVLGWEGSTV